jgi:hypothetical protein
MSIRMRRRPRLARLLATQHEHNTPGVFAGLSKDLLLSNAGSGHSGHMK